MQGGGFLYALGLLLAAARPLLGLWGVRRLSRACADAGDTPTLTTAAHCARLLGLPAPRLCRADVPVPMTWGWRRPVVVLPLASAAWPEGRLRSVLLHEMAHVKRRDWPGHRLADVACALLWFHPLVWLTARRLRAESELACDDLVLASGIPAPDYARHLLEIASALPRAAGRSHTAIAMAQTSQIESRLHMILDKTRTRRTVARRVLLTALIPGTAALVTLAVLRPDAKAQTAPAASVDASTASDASATTPSGNTRLGFRFGPGTNIRNYGGGKMDVTTGPDLTINGTMLFAGVADLNKHADRWWSAAGARLLTPVYTTPFADLVQTELDGTPEAQNIEFAFRLPPSAQGVTVRYKLPQSHADSSMGTWPGKSQSDAGHTESQMFADTGGVRVVTAAFPATLKKTNVQVGIASGAWKTTAIDNNLTGTSGFGGKEAFLFSAVVVTKDGLTLSISNNTSDDVRVIAITSQGQTVLPNEIGDNSVGALDQITAQFNNLSLSQIKEIRVQTRPFQWIEYKDVALKPVQ